MPGSRAFPGHLSMEGCSRWAIPLGYAKRSCSHSVDYRNLAYSALAYLEMGMSGSASPESEELPTAVASSPRLSMWKSEVFQQPGVDLPRLLAKCQVTTVG